MTVVAETPETVYMLTGAALGPLGTVWTAEAATDIAVWLDTGTGPALVSNAEYTVTLAGTLPCALNVTLNSALLPAGGAWGAVASLTLQRVTPDTQPTSFSSMTSFSPSVFEAALDHVVRQNQELKMALTRALAYAPGTYPAALPAPETLSGQYLTFDANGNPLAGAG